MDNLELIKSSTDILKISAKKFEEIVSIFNPSNEEFNFLQLVNQILLNDKESKFSELMDRIIKICIHSFDKNYKKTNQLLFIAGLNISLNNIIQTTIDNIYEILENELRKNGKLSAEFKNELNDLSTYGININVEISTEKSLNLLNPNTFLN